TQLGASISETEAPLVVPLAYSRHSLFSFTGTLIASTQSSLVGNVPPIAGTDQSLSSPETSSQTARTYTLYIVPGFNPSIVVLGEPVTSIISKSDSSSGNFSAEGN